MNRCKYSRPATGIVRWCIDPVWKGRAVSCPWNEDRQEQCNWYIPMEVVTDESQSNKKKGAPK